MDALPSHLEPFEDLLTNAPCGACLACDPVPAISRRRREVGERVLEQSRYSRRRGAAMQPVQAQMRRRLHELLFASILDLDQRCRVCVLRKLFEDSGDCRKGGFVARENDRSGFWHLAAAAPQPVQIIKRTDAGFVVQPRRWVVERTFAWASINRRLARDFEGATSTARAFFQIAMIKLMVRRIARYRNF